MFFPRILLLVLVSLTTYLPLSAQNTTVTVSGIVKDKTNGQPLSYANILVQQAKDSSFVTGTVSNEEGRFTFPSIKPGNYVLVASLVGYQAGLQNLYVGSLSAFLDAGNLMLIPEAGALDNVTVSAKSNLIAVRPDKQVYSLEQNISQQGGSVLQAMQNLPGITVQEGKLQLRGNDKVAILIDGKQTALTGFGNQSGLDNLPASSIDRIEIIQNPSAKYDANGNAGIINIILKKENKEGFNGKAGLAAGLGSLWIRQENYPTVRDQYQFTPKINPSLSLNYRKQNVNLFLQADNLYTHTLNKNDFVTRTYDDGTIIKQQLKRNRNTNFLNIKSGVDWNIDSHNTLTVSGFFGTEKIIDNGDQAFFNEDISKRLRMWQFLEDELKTTVMATAAWQHKFQQAGHLLNIGFNYTFHREDEKYFFDNIYDSFTGEDAFKLLSDEKVADFTVDYTRPLRYGRIETGIKIRKRDIPTNMQFFPGLNSPIDSGAGGKATYSEIIPAVYGNYVFENERYEAEAGLRIEYVDLQYNVNPNHNTYKSDGYDYFQPFPNLKFAYKFSSNNKISFAYNRRVDRPAEVDIRIFPKYDDAEIIKVGNPALKPQFTNSFELGYKASGQHGFLYAAAFHRFTDGTITRIATTVPGSRLIYAIFQNADRSYQTGIDLLWNEKVNSWYSTNLGITAYHNRIDGFQVNTLYPQPNSFYVDAQTAYSGNVKWLNNFKLSAKSDAQVSATWLAPDIIPQGKVKSRFSLDAGWKTKIQKDRGELFANATDLLSTMALRKTVQGNGFSYTSDDYYETQVIRVGYSYKF